MILGIAIYLIGFFLVLWLFYREARNFYKANGELHIRLGEAAFCVVVCLFSWVGALALLCMWVQNHADEVIINFEKKKKDD